MTRALLTIFFVTSLAAQTSSEVQLWIAQGVGAMQAGRHADAIASFQKAVDLNPASVPAHYYLANAFAKLYIPGAESAENVENGRRLEDELSQVVRLDPNHHGAMAALASLYVAQKRWDEGKAWYERLVAVDPNTEAYHALGYIAWSKWYPAYQAARQSAGMRPEDPGPIPAVDVRQGLQVNYSGLVEAGIANLEKALQLNPQNDDAMAYMNLFIRERADMRATKAEWQSDIAIADDWVQRALQIKKRKAETPGTIAAPPPPEGVLRIRVGGSVQASKMLQQIDPVYPPLAKQARIQGIVRFTLTIGRDGTVVNAQLVSGHPLLVPPAIDAVKQWVYQPTLLNGAPVEVVTEADVQFRLP